MLVLPCQCYEGRQSRGVGTTTADRLNQHMQEERAKGETCQFIILLVW
jgi:hypothetical protein